MKRNNNIVHHALSQEDDDDDNENPNYHSNVGQSSSSGFSSLMASVDDEDKFESNSGGLSSIIGVCDEDEFNIDPRLYAFDDDDIEGLDGYQRNKKARKNNSTISKSKKRKELLERLQERREQQLSFLPSPRFVLVILFSSFLAAALYIQFATTGGLGKISFPDFSSYHDDDDDDDDNNSFMPESNNTTEDEGKSVVLEDESKAHHQSKCNEKQDQHGITYDPDAYLKEHDPFHVNESTWYGGFFQNPPHPSIPLNMFDESEENIIPRDNVGYIKEPNVFNNTIVFCSEGDVYLTSISINDNKIMPAMRLTSTIGNVNSPKINPKFPFLVAFTATYSGHREVYLMDLRSDKRSNPSMRLTYFDSLYGVLSIAGWEDDGTSLIVSSYNREIAMEDVRLYKIGIIANAQSDRTGDGNNQSRFSASFSHSVTISSITSIPLSQAIDGAIDDSSGCRYFTRFKQSSNTARYVGGTAESLWAYCPEESRAIPLTDDYNGTSTSPDIYHSSNGNSYLVFLSDRAETNTGSWTSSTMNLWISSIPTHQQIYRNSKKKIVLKPTKLTSVSCKLGMSIQEYSVDKTNGNIILRVGADLHMIKESDIIKQLTLSHKSAAVGVDLEPLPIAVYSDFDNLHERMVPIDNPTHVTSIDIFGTAYGSTSALMTARGQVFINPVIPNVDSLKPYGGGAMNLPARRYRVAPGSLTGGMVRILGSWFIPHSESMALMLATDPLSSTAEMAFYIIDVSAGLSMNFADVTNLPLPIIGGHINGGSVADGGLGSISVESVAMSPCGRRVAWTDTDGRIVAMTLPKSVSDSVDVMVLPQTNNLGEPMTGIDARLTFSPAGRYLAIEHTARNKFRVITIGDLGETSGNHLIPNRFVQATSNRFNSMNPLWGRSPIDFKVAIVEYTDTDHSLLSTTLYFLTDRDILLSQNTSPWGTRGPQPFFGKRMLVYALPLINKENQLLNNSFYEIYGDNYVGGGGAELMLDRFSKFEQEKNLSAANESQLANDKQKNEKQVISDLEISFDDASVKFPRRAYLITQIPASDYVFIHQLLDDPSLILAERNKAGSLDITVFAIGSYPNNSMERMVLQVPGKILNDLGVSSDRNYLHFTYSGVTKVVLNEASAFMNLFVQDAETFTKNLVDTQNWMVNIWPKLEYQQMYSDAWRMLRDFFYDPHMGNVDWIAVHDRYLPLVARCGRREELDDVLKQMASELSALHVFVYGGEYNEPLHGDPQLISANQICSFGAVLERSVAWGGYLIKDIPEIDPDFSSFDGKAIYSPLSHATLRMSGQKGLLAGDVIVAVNGESVLTVPDINMLLRGMSGRSIRLEVLRIKSSQPRYDNNTHTTEAFMPEPLIVVPISLSDAENLRYAAWEWQKRSEAKSLADQNGFGVGYMHLRSMSGAEGEDAFVRGYYEDFDKEGMIIDVRHNHGGNIDSWLLDVLQRKAWMYWQGRSTNITTGGLGWDEQYAFRGHIVVLIDEKTSSDGEAFSRGISELGLGKLIGTRTWGGGVWLASDNTLIDGGIATAPEYGTYNAKFGWGLGIENMGVEPDIWVDNNPRETFDGRDEQLEIAVQTLKDWIKKEPIVIPRAPHSHKNMALDKQAEGCLA